MRHPLFAVVPLVTSCWVAVKTPLVAQYERLDALTFLDTDQDDIELAIGTPQGIGIHRLGEQELSAAFYQGLIGRVSISGSLKADYGMAFVSYEGSHVEQVFYARSSQSDPAIRIRGPLPIVALANQLTLGVSHIEDVVEVLGHSAFRGRRINKSSGIQHDIVWYDRSEPPSSFGPLKERFVLLGYDQDRVVQDLMWISSFPEDSKGLGTVNELRFNQFSKLDLGSWTGWQLTAFSTDRIDTMQVDALLRSTPQKIEEFVEVLGPPTARGIKSFQEHEPLLVAAWSSIKSELLGRESYAMPDQYAPNGQRIVSYVVNDMPQSRLIVAHRADGQIEEIMWFAPRGVP